MAKISRDYGALVGQPLHPRENIGVSGSLGALNAVVVAPCDGCATVSIDLRGTFNLTVEVQGTVDGVNWTLIPVRPQLGGIYVRGLVGSGTGVWMASCAGFTSVRAIAAAYTSGAVTVALVASTARFDPFADAGGVTSNIGTVTAAIGVAATLTLAAPGIGLRHYITYLAINRFAGAVLTPAATPVLVTTTNLPGTLVFSVPIEAAAQGTMDRYREDFAWPLMAVAQNTATTIVAPVLTGAIWRITAGFYVAP